MSASAPSRGLGPFASLAITVVWLTILAPLAYPYLNNEQEILEIQDKYGILAIAWLGGLGAITASFVDIARKADKWNPHLAIWFAVRPIVGAAFGAIGYLIYQAVVDLSVTEGSRGLKQPTVLGYVIAFTLGYREELFRELLKRVTDLLATAGGADVEPPSAPPGLTRQVGLPTGNDVTISWNSSSDNVAVAGYNVYRNRRFLATVLVRQTGRNVPTTQHQNGDASGSRSDVHTSDSGRDTERISFTDYAVKDYAVKDSRTYLYSVTAIDDAGNESAPAGPVRVHLSPAEEHRSS
jgi:hypothetical protein